ncbi:hypothetical protein ACFX14_026811 [Malus domestica]
MFELFEKYAFSMFKRKHARIYLSLSLVQGYKQGNITWSKNGYQVPVLANHDMTEIRINTSEKQTSSLSNVQCFFSLLETSFSCSFRSFVYLRFHLNHFYVLS